MPIRALLLVLMVVGLYLEAQAPGLIIPGVVAVIAMVLLLAAPFIIGLAEWWHILLFVIGVVLFILEMVPPPTFGLLAVAGIVMMFVGLVLAVVPTSGHSALPPAEMTARLQQSAVWTLLGLFGSGIGFYYITVYFGKIPFLSKLILRSPPPSNPLTQLAAAQAGLTAVSGDEVIGRGLIRIGHVGKAVSTLRPTGRADIDGQIIDVISVGQWIETGTSVRVVEVQGNRIVVDIDEQK